MSKKKCEQALSKALDAKSPEDAMKILRDAGMFMSIQCHGYSNNYTEHSLIQNTYNTKKWWQFWK